MNKVRLELGLSEWAEFGKLVKSNPKGILEKDHSILQDRKMGEDCHVPGTALNTLHV